MYCPHCSAWNEDGTATCGYCQRDLALGAAAPAAHAAPKPALPPGSAPPRPAAPGMTAPPVGPFGMPPGATSVSPGLPMAGYERRPSPQQSLKATWSLALGAIGVLCFFVGILTGIPGLLLGLFGYRECVRSPERWTGKGYAIAGIAANAVALGIALLMGLYYAAKVENLLTAGRSEWGGQPIEALSPYASDATIMVQIIPALESYRAEHNAWPMWAAGPRGANGHVSQYDPAFHMPTFRAWGGGGAERGTFAMLTTPVAYLTNFVPDPDAAVVSGEATFGYFTNGEGWIVYSPGPDKVYDIDPLTMYPAGGLNQKAFEALVARHYDPTNGAISRGDIIYIAEDVEE